MKEIKPATAGTLESSDCLVAIAPGEGGIAIHLQSSVEAMFGDDIRATVQAVLSEQNITNATLSIQDRGALDCVIRARTECAICRATQQSFDWSREEAYHNG